VILRVRAGELTRVVLAFLAFFLLLSSYYMLRPVRDEMGVRTGVERLQWLFSGTFVFMLLTVPAFGWVVKHVPRARLLPAVYGFVVLNLLVFYAAFAAGVTAVTAAAFFIWLSVFNLIVVSLFWSNVSDAFTTEQSHRLYGYIAAGGTAGALAGPALTALLARFVSSAHLLALSATLLAAAAACMVLLRRAHPVDSPAEARPIGGSVLAGVPLTLKLPSLRGIALLVICYTAVHTVLYVEIADLAQRTYPDSGERTAFFASLDLAVNTLALAVQLLLTRPIVQRFGLAAALAVVPLVVLAGLAAAGIWRTALLLAGTQIANRAGEFSLVRPGREMIYTTVDPESRYKAKNFIDTVVYRGNDAVFAWLISTIRAAGLDAVVLVAIPVALAYLGTGLRVGRRHDRNGA
jgi:AAA family ATP:ADP antiporter